MSVETRAAKQQYLNGQADAEGILEPSDSEACDGKGLPALSEIGKGEASGQSAQWQPPDRATGTNNGGSSLGRPIERHDPNAAEKEQQQAPAPPVVARSLDSVRSSLIRQEETIIFSLIEREQFGHNPKIYTDRDFRLNRKDVADIYGRDASFLEYMLCETEKLHATVRRYMSLEELAFFPMFLPEPILPALNFPRLLAPNDVNVNDQILKRYISEIVPVICEPGDDNQHGSSVVCDVNALQALSRRVHLGKFVAESKFQEDNRTYQELCRAGDAAGVLELLTNKAVEERVLQRAFMKASTYGSDINDLPIVGDSRGPKEGAKNFKVDPQSIVDIYRDLVIPLTKDVEIMYLFQRTGYPCPSLEGIHH